MFGGQEALVQRACSVDVQLCPNTTKQSIFTMVYNVHEPQQNPFIKPSSLGRCNTGIGWGLAAPVKQAS